MIDERNFIQRLFKRPRIKRKHWSLTHDGEILLFGRKCINSSARYTTAELAKRLTDMHKKIAETSSPMKIENVMIESHVASDLIIAGEITVETLLQAKEYEHYIEVHSYDFDGIQMSLEIRQNCYYEGYQFGVYDHPEGYVVSRDVPDLLAVLTGDPV